MDEDREYQPTQTDLILLRLFGLTTVAAEAAGYTEDNLIVSDD